jgi:hypothetical protein
MSVSNFGSRFPAGIRRARFMRKWPGAIYHGKNLFTFGDERCVPPENDESNFRMANEALFRPASVPDSSILRMRGEIEPVLAAKEYEAELDGLAAKRGEKIYEHDLILLGWTHCFAFSGNWGALGNGAARRSQLRSQIKFMAADLHFPINFRGPERFVF